MPVKTKTAGWGLVAIAVAAGALYYFRSGDSGGPAGPRGFGPAPVVVAAAVTDEFVDSLHAVGTAKSNESVELTAKVTDAVRRIRYEDGEFVKKGAVLVELTRAEESAMLDEALAGLDDARKNYHRAAELDEKDMVAKTEVQTRTATFKAADARVQAIQARLADRLIRAPFSGVLGLRNISPGKVVSPGEVVAALDDISVIKLDFSVPETDLAAVKVGLEILAQSPAYPGRDFTGRVTGVDTRVDPVTRSFVVRAEIPNPDSALRPGMMMSVNLVQERRRSLMIPEGAVLVGPTGQYCFAVGADNKIAMRPLVVGGRRPGAVEIKSGLDEGDLVVVEGVMKVRPGGDAMVVKRVDTLTGEVIETAPPPGGPPAGGSAPPSASPASSATGNPAPSASPAPAGAPSKG